MGAKIKLVSTPGFGTPISRKGETITTIKVEYVGGSSNHRRPGDEPQPFEGRDLIPELVENATRQLKDWLKQHKFLKERCDLYDAVEMAVEMAETPKEPEPAKAKKRKKGGA